MLKVKWLFLQVDRGKVSLNFSGKFYIVIQSARRRRWWDEEGEQLTSTKPGLNSCRSVRNIGHPPVFAIPPPRPGPSTQADPTSGQRPSLWLQSSAARWSSAVLVCASLGVSTIALFVWHCLQVSSACVQANATWFSWSLDGGWKTRQTFSFIDFKDVVSELALHAKSKMIIFMSGPLQGFSYFGRNIKAINFSE